MPQTNTEDATTTVVFLSFNPDTRSRDDFHRTEASFISLACIAIFLFPILFIWLISLTLIPFCCQVLFSFYFCPATVKDTISLYFSPIYFVTTDTSSSA
jgi:hypothetical protein